MQKIKIVILAIVWIGLGAGQSLALDPAPRNLAEKLLLLMNQDQLVQQSIDYLKDHQRQQLPQLNDSQTQAVMATYLDKIYEVIESEMSWEKIKNDYIDLYLTVYSKEEIEGLIAFYEAPLGRKVIEKMPELMAQSMWISQKHLVRIIPEIEKIQREMAGAMENP